MKTYVCTCGTSIAGKSGVNIERFKNIPLSRKQDYEDDVGAAKDRIASKIDKLTLDFDLDDTSAEIKSLMRMGICPEDRLILIASDTIDGMLCAELVKEFLVDNKIIDERLVTIKIIPGLQATDGNLFQKEGLKNLLSFLINLEHEDLVLNPTGGYKSVVPYISLIGMLFNKPVRYIHEDSSDILTLTNLPIVLNDDLMLSVEHKLRLIEEKTAIRETEWQSGIDYSDHRFDCLVEHSDGLVTMSGVGLLFWERYKKDFPDDLPRYSRSASEKENKLLTQGIGHHGLKKLMKIASKILESPFVKGIPKSCDNQPTSKTWVKPLLLEEAERHLQRKSQAICIVTDINTDAGYSFLIHTTATTDEENNRIADILKTKFFK